MKFKKYLKKIIPDRQVFQKHDSLKLIHGILHDPDIFHLTRRSVAGGIATGLFICFFPVPGHMLMAAIAAIVLRVNLPLAVAFVWVSNPLSMPPIFYLEYRLGSFLLDRPPRNVSFEMTMSWFSGTFMEIWPALFVGACVFAVITAAIGYAVVRLLWRLAVIQKWEQRKKRIMKYEER
ncbi:MAG: DUF2062 domain-containing protein [Gammaproteobacteria bacterium]